MQKSKKFLSLALAIVMVLSLAVPAAAYDVPEAAIKTPEEIAEVKKGSMTGKTVILHSNDVHGAIDGYAYIAALEDVYEKAGAEVILADAGDFSQGTTYVSISKGADAITMMNAAGYDLVTLGNHEFDYGYEKLMENLGKGKFKALCADVLSGGKTILDATYVYKTKSGVKLGFFGLETPETQTKVNPGLIKGVTFLSNSAGKTELYECGQKQVDALKKAGADLVIGLVHLGVDDESAGDGHRSVDLLAHVKGVDMLIDGHSHTVMTSGADGEPIQSTGTKFANIGVVVIDDKTKTIEDNYLVATRIMGKDKDDKDIVLSELPKDKTVAAKAEEITQRVDKEYGAVFAKSEVELWGTANPGNRTKETNNGNLITDAMMWNVIKEGGLSLDKEYAVAITNGGGIRAPIKAGDITMKDINTDLPFGNTLAVVYVTGSELLEALEASTFATPGAIGGFPQTAGMKWTVNTGMKYDANADTYPGSTYYGPASIRRVTIESVNGKAFDPKATYAVITNNFCAAGGDTYYAFKRAYDAGTGFDTGIALDAAVVNYITEELKGVITAEKYGGPEGRLTIVNRPADLDEKAWWYDTAIWALDANVMQGTNKGFEADANVTRASVLQTLYNMSGKPAVEKAALTDVEGKWWADAANWGAAAGLVKGTTFGDDAAILRGGVKDLLETYGKLTGADYSNLMLGDQNGNLMLDKTLTRAEFAQLLARMNGAAAGYATLGPCSVTAISKYGNVGTDLSMDALTAAGYEVGDILTVEITGQEPVTMPLGTGYSNVDQGSALALADTSNNTLAMAINRGDFATAYGLGAKGEDKTYAITPGKTITISMAEKGGYLDEMEIRELDSKRTNNREDYVSDAIFANFRPITMGSIADGRLYRTSSPVNPELGRNTYADAFLKEAGVKTVINLADSKEAMEAYEGYADTYYSTLKVINLNMGVDMYSDDAKQSLKKGLEFMIANEGPYAFHCTEGKDRAGYFAMLLEALMGGKLRDIVGDYMQSFENYYFVKADSEQWSKIAESNIEKDVMKLTGTEDIFAAGDADLAAAAEKYMVEELGLTKDQVSALKKALSK